MLAPGAITEWTLTLHSSEYRYTRSLEVTDNLPSGLCPIAEENLSFGESPECAAAAGHLPQPPGLLGTRRDAAASGC